MPSPIPDAIVTELQRMRMRLLDLSNRNRLLNYLHRKGSSLRVIDEIPSAIFERIAVPSNTLLFESLPPYPQTEDPAGRAAGEDDLSAWATSLGIDPSFDLPSTYSTGEPRHADNKLQTLLLPEHLEKRLHAINRRAQGALSETGVNLLHLMFGFVEWLDGPVSDPAGTRRYAPLVLMPVALEREARTDRETNTFRYRVSRTTEDWSTNVTLQEKCRQIDGVEIPSLDEEDEHLESYFAAVEALLPKDWRLRRWVTLGLVSFGKILMWRDLDPRHWRTDQLAERGVLRQMLGDETGGTTGEDPGAMDQVYEIDRLPDPPSIVVEADSSQHSVLVDVHRGRSLVVEGPPGTGKSQTIVNLIANALLRGQRVLFVAEKFAALDVVYRRLQQAQLGEFCLALHSQKPRSAFLQEMAEAMNLRGIVRPPERVEETLSAHNGTKEALTMYVNRLHEPAGPLEISLFTVLWRARWLIDRLGRAAQRGLEDAIVPNPIAVTRSDLAAGRAVMERVGRAIAAADSEVHPVEGHPWAGVTAPLETQQAQGEVIQRARIARRALERLEAPQRALESLLGIPPIETPGILDESVAAAQKLADFGAADDAILRRVWEANDDTRFTSVLERLVALQATWASLPAGWRTPEALGAEGTSLSRSMLGRAAALVGSSGSVGDLEGKVAAAQALAARLDAVENLVVRLADDLGIATPATLTGQLALLRVIRAGVDLGPVGWGLRRPGLQALTAPAVLVTCAERAAALRAEAAVLDVRLTPAMRPGRSELLFHLHALLTAPRALPQVWSRAYRAAVRAYRAMRQGQGAPRAAMQAELHRLLKQMDAVVAFVRASELREVWGEEPLTLGSPIREAAAVAVWCHESRTALQPLGPDGETLIEGFWTAPAQSWQRAAARLANDQNVVLVAAEVEESLLGLLPDVQATVAPAPVRDGGATIAHTLRQWSVVLDAAHTVLNSSRTSLDHTPIETILSFLDGWDAATEKEQGLSEELAWLRGLGFEFPNARAPLEPLKHVAVAVRGLYESQLPPAWQRWIVVAAHQRREQLLAAAGTLQHPLEELVTALPAFGQAAALDVTAWHPDAASLLDVPFAHLTSRLVFATSREAALYRWSERGVALAAAKRAGLTDLCELVRSKVITTGSAADAYEAVVLMTVGRQFLNDPILHGAFGEQLDATRLRFRELDDLVIKLTRQLIRSRLASRPPVPGQRGHRVTDLTNEALLQHEAKKQKRFIPVRALFARAGRAIANLKPCFLMSPFAVAQYISRTDPPFDLVIMDEASQMRPEDALGAVARARQLIVVGDTKQLPPTDFFQKVQDQDGDGAAMDESAVPEDAGIEMPEAQADATVLQRAESILHVARDKFPHRMLQWHYRSRHPKLIAFSNRTFYENRLIVFPTPTAAADQAGVEFRRVAGTWENGTNVDEAAEVAAAARAHAATRPAQSLMIAAMNREQADLIDELLTKAEKDDSVWASYRDYWEHRPDADEQEPFRVKNLENVQGDERDCVLISVTYGPDRQGNLFQRFGPILRPGGERRLNVLFTRARHHMALFCSFDPESLRVAPSSPRGLAVFQQYLLYAKDVDWAQGQDSGREPDSEFEVAVADALRGRGLQVKAQVGVSGYFIDLAVVDPEHPTRFLLGLECDGATYHSAKSARDRDRLRQQILQRLGWSIHRIWSTDWFRDPDGQVERVLARLRDEGQ